MTTQVRLFAERRTLHIPDSVLDDIGTREECQLIFKGGRFTRGDAIGDVVKAFKHTHPTEHVEGYVFVVDLIPNLHYTITSGAPVEVLGNSVPLVKQLGLPWYKRWVNFALQHFHPEGYFPTSEVIGEEISSVNFIRMAV